jgi:hypothetical protein
VRQGLSNENRVKIEGLLKGKESGLVKEMESDG